MNQGARNMVIFVCSMESRTEMDGNSESYATYSEAC